ncbi:MAG: laccase domain-containing protein, partial [Myxococcota bacterium]
MSARVQHSEALDALGRIAHGFSTRHGGVSIGTRASLDLDDPDDARRIENWRRLLADVGLGSTDRVAWLKQVHGDTIVAATSPTGPLRPVAEGDALYATAPGVVLAVRTADCVPVLLAGPGVVAAAHSGWRGTAVDIVGKLVQTLVAEVGVDPADLVAGV